MRENMQNVNHYSFTDNLKKTAPFRSLGSPEFPEDGISTSDHINTSSNLNDWKVSNSLKWEKVMDI